MACMQCLRLAFTLKMKSAKYANHFEVYTFAIGLKRRRSGLKPVENRLAPGNVCESGRVAVANEFLVFNRR